MAPASGPCARPGGAARAPEAVNNPESFSWRRRKEEGFNANGRKATRMNTNGPVLDVISNRVIGRAFGCKLCLLLNFGTPRLEIRRVALGL